MNEMRLIMESWRGFQEEELQTDILLEGTEKQVSFKELIVEYNNNIITEQQISQLWVESFDYEASLLIQEVGLLDALGKAKDKVVAAYNTFITKQFLRVKDFLSGTLEKIKNSAGIVATILRKIVGWVGKLCGKAPLLCKITLGLAMVFAASLVMAIFADDAEASIKIGQTVYESDSSTLDAVKGLCGVIHETSPDNETKNQAKNCISLINRHAASDQIMDVADQLDRGGALIKKVASTVHTAAKLGQEQMESGDASLSQTLMQLVDLGQEQTLEITTKVSKVYTKIRSEYGSSTSTSTSTFTRKVLQKTGEMVPMKGKVDYTNIAKGLGKIATGK